MDCEAVDDSSKFLGCLKMRAFLGSVDGEGHKQTSKWWVCGGNFNSYWIRVNSSRLSELIGSGEHFHESLHFHNFPVSVGGNLPKMERFMECVIHRSGK